MIKLFNYNKYFDLENYKFAFEICLNMVFRLVQLRFFCKYKNSEQIAHFSCTSNDQYSPIYRHQIILENTNARRNCNKWQVCIPADFNYLQMITLVFVMSISIFQF